MKKIIVSLILVLATNFAFAQSSLKVSNGVVIEEIINNYAKSSGEKVLIDPRVKARVNLYGMPVQDINFDILTTILKTHNFSWYRSGNLLVIVPTNVMKQNTVRLVEPGKEYSANEMVDALIKVDKICPYHLVSVLRPLMPPTSQLAVLDEPRFLVLTDTYQNTERMRKLVQGLEARQEKLQACPDPVRVKE